MKTARKVLLLVLCAALLVSASVMGTLAYLNDISDTAVNTFTVGKVNIELDEAEVDEYGKVVSQNRVTENEYKLLPGHEYTKDPTVTVAKGSEQAYVRMIVTMTEVDDAVVEALDDVGGVILLQNYVDWNADTTKWECVSATKEGTTCTYEFWYKDIVDAREEAQKLEALFTTITMPGTLSNEAVAALDGVNINVVANAIQADGFDSAEEAWGEW